MLQQKVPIVSYYSTHSLILSYFVLISRSDFFFQENINTLIMCQHQTISLWWLIFASTLLGLENTDVTINLATKQFHSVATICCCQ